MASSSEQEFASFYREHIRRLIAYLIYRGASADLAAELTQEAMTAAYKHWRKITSPRAYVWKVADRAFTRTRHAPEEPVAEVPEPPVVLPHPDEAEVWLGKQQAIEVLRALPSRQRQVLALTIDGWTPAEIAELLVIPSPAVRSNLRKARRNAAEYIRRLGEEDP